MQKRLRKPLGALGVLLGFVAASVVAPSGCTMSEAQAGRLHVALPLAGPVALLLALAWVGRKLALRERSSTRSDVAWSVALAFAAAVVFNAIAAVTYELSSSTPGDFAMAFVVFGPTLMPLLVVSPLLVAAARRAEEVRSGSMLHAHAERTLWVPVLGGAAVAQAASFATADRFPPVLPIASLALSALSLLLVLRFIERAQAGLRRLDALAVAKDARDDDGRLVAIDLGLGETPLVEDGDAGLAYRARPPVFEGDPARARAYLESARAGATAGALVIVIGLAVSARAYLVKRWEPPPPVEPPVALPWNRC